jgi:transglutaminase-like putative cysteine protease
LLRYIATLVLLFPGPATPSEPETPDIAYREYRQIKLGGVRRDRDGVGSKVRVEITCLSEQGAKNVQYFVIDRWGAEVNQVTARVNGRKIDKRYVDFYYPKGRDEFFSETRVWSITYPKLIGVGDTLSYEYEIKYDNPAQFDLLSIPNLNYVEHYELEFEHPPTVAIDFEWYFPADSVPIRIERINDKTLRVIVDSLPKRRNLPNCDDSDVHALGIASFRCEDQLLTPTTPESFVPWYLGEIRFPLNVAAEAEPDLKEAVDNASDQLAAVELIYDFVRTNFRYVSDVTPPHTIFPHPPIDVLAHRYGDCKDRAFLVATLAARHGITVFPCIVSSGRTRMFEGVHTQLFNHVACAIDTDDGTMFFDPTPRHFAMGTLPPEEAGHFAVILDSTHPRVEEIWPRDTLPDLEVHLSGRVDSLDHVRARILVRGGYRSEVLATQEEESAYELRRALSARLPAYLFRIALDSFALEPLDNRTLEISAWADLTAFAIKSPNCLYLPKNPFIITERDVLERENDPWPLMTGIPRRYALTLDLVAPGYATVADSLILTAGDIAELRGTIQQTEPGQFRAEYYFRLSAATATGDLRRAYLEFCRGCLDSKRNLFTIEEGTEP